MILADSVNGRIPKRALEENESRQISRKANISYPPIRTLRCAYQGVRNLGF